MILGMSYILGVKYRKVIMKAHPIGWGASFLDEAIPDKDGKKKSDIPSILDRPKYLYNLAIKKDLPELKVAFRWRDTKKFGDADIKATVKHLRKFIKIANDSPNPRTVYVYNYHLENESLSAFNDKMIRHLQKEPIPDNMRLMNNPVHFAKGVHSDKNVILEYHHNDFNKRAGFDMSFDFDGVDCLDANLWKYLKEAREANARSFYLWTWTFNLKQKKKDDRKRPKRIFKPIKKLLTAMTYLPKDHSKAYLSDSRNTYKAYAEPVKNNIIVRIFQSYNSRSWKPLFLIVENGICVTLICKKTGKVTKLKREKEYEPQHRKKRGYPLYIYRSKQWGFEIGTDLCDAFVSGKKIGEVYPTHRQGNFRNDA